MLNALATQLGEEDFKLSTAPEEEHRTQARYAPWTQEELNTFLRQPWPNWPNAMWLQRVPRQDQETDK